MKGFDIAGMAKYVDFFNFMSYDIHGTWDGNSEWTDSAVNAHTNLTGMFVTFGSSILLSRIMLLAGLDAVPL